MDVSTVSSLKNLDWDLNDKYFRLKRKSIKKLITLPPKYLGNLNKGIEEAIFKSSQEIFKEFNGVPISMGKKTLLQNVGTSIDDYPFIQFYVELDCVVFCPKVGKKVKATVTKFSESFIGCLICGRINATIFRKGKRANYTIANDEAVDEAKEADLNSLYIGQEILIKIKSIQYEKNNDLFIAAYFVKTL